MSAKREGGFKLQMFLGELPRPEEFQNDRWSEKDGFHGRAGEDDREPQQTFYKKYHNFFIFQAIFFIHTSKKLLRYNLFKDVWILRIE